MSVNRSSTTSFEKKLFYGLVMVITFLAGFWFLVFPVLFGDIIDTYSSEQLLRVKIFFFISGIASLMLSLQMYRLLAKQQ